MLGDSSRRKRGIVACFGVIVCKLKTTQYSRYLFSFEACLFKISSKMGKKVHKQIRNESFLLVIFLIFLFLLLVPVYMSHILPGIIYNIICVYAGQVR